MSRRESCDLSCDISYTSFYRSGSRHRIGTPNIVNSQSFVCGHFSPDWYRYITFTHNVYIYIFAVFFDIFAVMFLKTQTLSVNTITCYYGPPFLTFDTNAEVRCGVSFGCSPGSAAAYEHVNKQNKQSFCSSTPYSQTTLHEKMFILISHYNLRIKPFYKSIYIIFYTMYIPSITHCNCKKFHEVIKLLLCFILLFHHTIIENIF